MDATATTTSFAGKVTRFLACPHNHFGEQKFSDESSVVSDDVEFEFLDDGELSSAASNDHHCRSLQELDFDEDDEEDVDQDKDQFGTIEKNRSFWENQLQGLLTNVYRTSSLETKIRIATKEAIEEIKSGGTLVCGCNKNMYGCGNTCRSCLMREVSSRLQNAGFNTAICKTKWRTSLDIPAGEHTFLDVIDNTNPKKGEVRVMIELNFQAEFEMARGSEEYNKLVEKLPEVFVGKVERLSNLIKILCMAAKKCMKDKKMHMGPWRKHRYMQAKWLGPCERNTSTIPLSMGNCSERKPKSKASLLTVDLLEKLPNMSRTTLEVVY